MARNGVRAGCLDGRYRRSVGVIAAVGVVVSLFTGCGSPSKGKVSGDLALRSCTTGGPSARCGTLMVREDRTAKGGRQIPIRVVVIPASGPKRQSDPIVWFAGGPGDSAVDMIARVRPLFGSSTSRDLVFIDQRGTGASHLTCPAFPGLDNKVALRASVESCLQHLNANLGSYTTAMSVDDVNEVLAALHYNHVNLVGISYGTSAEQMFLLRHLGRVRTMTLLSGTLLTIPVFERFPQNAQLALNNIFAECAGEPSCHKAFPDLSADWTALWTSITTQPWVVPASRSPDGKQAVFTADWVARSLHQAMTVATAQASIPL